MSVMTAQFRSRALRRDVTYSALAPVVGDGPFAVVLQLHGRGDTHTSWLLNSQLRRHAERYPMLIVMPDGAISAYLNLPALTPESWVGEQRYEAFIVEDLWEQVRRMFRVREGRWGIGGLSMGGFGAMRLGLKYPDHFASIWAHSGVYYQREEMVGVYPDPDDADTLRYARQVVALPEAERPVVSFDCGVEDRLIEQNRRLHRAFTGLGLAHHYAEHAGGHTWEYWDTHVREALEQHARALDAPRVAVEEE